MACWAMPRAKRYLVEGYTYHLTHRCHDRERLLKFSRDKDGYREWLRRGVKRYKVPVYAYCITSSHVHLVCHVHDREAVGQLMNLVAGATARRYNRRKGRSGAFWEDAYQSTAVQDGAHLWRCLRYVDLNMVRAGVVTNPADWPWCGYDELMGTRQRYRVVDLERLLRSLAVTDLRQFRDAYAAGIHETLARGRPTREPEWTESLAVGSKEFVERVASETGRHELTYEQVVSLDGSTTWLVKEAGGSYDSVSLPRTRL